MAYGFADRAQLTARNRTLWSIRPHTWLGADNHLANGGYRHCTLRYTSTYRSGLAWMHEVGHEKSH